MSKDLDIFHIDAFAEDLFSGNPAAVVPLQSWLDDEVMLKIAQENNLSETAFFINRLENGAYPLRWFTPGLEVSFCGHATLATAAVLFNHLGFSDDILSFDTQVGRLSAKRVDGGFELDFPSEPGEALPLDDRVAKVLGETPMELLNGRYLLAVFENEDQVLSLKPDMNGIVEVAKGLEVGCVIATAPGSDVDFVSRFFGPGAGIPEDPVTGSAHSQLTPYWARRLGKNILKARQGGARQGSLLCRLEGDRVFLTGSAVTYLKGKIFV